MRAIGEAQPDNAVADEAVNEAHDEPADQGADEGAIEAANEAADVAHDDEADLFQVSRIMLCYCASQKRKSITCRVKRRVRREHLLEGALLWCPSFSLAFGPRLCPSARTVNT